MTSKEYCNLPDSGRLSTPPISYIEKNDLEFSLYEEDEIHYINQEYRWFLETELAQTLQAIGNLLTCCQAQLRLDSCGAVHRALLIPEQSSEYVSGTVHLESGKISRADLFIKPSPKSSNKNRVSATIKGVSNSWKLSQITDADNQLKQIMQKFSHLIHRQDLHKLYPKPLSFLIIDIIESLLQCQNFFHNPKRPKMKDIQSGQVSFKPPLPEDIMLNIFISSFHLVITVFYLSTTPHRSQLQNIKPIVSISQQESLINSIVDGVGGKELEVVFQGEGTCPIPHIKHLLLSIRACLLHCQALLDKIYCFSNL